VHNTSKVFGRFQFALDAGQGGTPKPFLMIINWIKVREDWKVASEIILPVPPVSAAKG
jgi:hypothetical protein